MTAEPQQNMLYTQCQWRVGVRVLLLQAVGDRNEGANPGYQCQRSQKQSPPRVHRGTRNHTLGLGVVESHLFSGDKPLMNRPNMREAVTGAPKSQMRRSRKVNQGTSSEFSPTQLVLHRLCSLH